MRIPSMIAIGAELNKLQQNRLQRKVRYAGADQSKQDQIRYIQSNLSRVQQINHRAEQSRLQRRSQEIRAKMNTEETRLEQSRLEKKQTRAVQNIQEQIRVSESKLSESEENKKKH